MQENINTLTPSNMERLLEAKFGDIRTGLHMQFEKGEITSDAYGRGSLQRMIEEE